MSVTEENDDQPEAASLAPTGNADTAHNDAVYRTRQEEEVSTTAQIVEEQKFPHGEIEGSSTSNNVDPATITERFVYHRTNSVKEALLSTVTFAKGVTAAKTDHGKSKAFFDGMVKVKALTKKDAAEDIEGKKVSPMTSKLRKIAEYADFLGDDKIASMIPQEKTVLYALAKVCEA